jgi:AcrR family transcriptional regulator
MKAEASNLKDLRGDTIESLKPRDRILKTACALFNEYGVNTIGIDRIIAESSVSKRTFYNHFPSKNELIAAYLESKDWLRFSDLDKYVSRMKGNPRDEILVIFDFLEQWFSEKDFNGCAFSRGLSDFNNEDAKPLRAIVDLHFAHWTEFIKERLTKLVKPDKITTLLLQLLSLITGSVIVTQGTGDLRVAQFNKKIARELLVSYSH